MHFARNVSCRFLALFKFNILLGINCVSSFYTWRVIEVVITRQSWKTIVLITSNSPKPLILLGFSHLFLHFARWASRSFLAIFLISYFGICWLFGQFDTRRVIEAVITRWSWKPFAGNGAWVRISHPPPHRGQDGSLDPVFFAYTASSVDRTLSMILALSRLLSLSTCA